MTGPSLLSGLSRRSLRSRPGRRYARPLLAARQSNDGNEDENSGSSWHRVLNNLRSIPTEFIALGLYVVYDFGSGYYIGRYKAKARFSSNSYAWMPWSGEDTGDTEDETAREDSLQSMSKGSYTPLWRSFEIRLLAIHPGKGDSAVECSLRHQKLRGNPSYEALSYV
ncbi:hypothetical protein B0J13DRAFT_151865 [Dactylonectria estremocensis]|uniref:Uncharacterized protein n=1 Tax=Dactylonectria estremocensis TaxID=1079267 RepID=A0A9P9IIE7_9HYPO|nr:hypothetical protein B0J13DRAFT_151865 [Dactylonectria estremocensis]